MDMGGKREDVRNTNPLPASTPGHPHPRWLDQRPLTLAYLLQNTDAQAHTLER